MKNLVKLILPLSLAFISASGFSEDYYVPVPKELEGFARLQLPSFKMTDTNVLYTLPKELVGSDLEVSLDRDTTIDFPRIYRGQRADIACMGTNELPVCSVAHKNIGTKAELLSAGKEFLKTKYRDPAKLLSAEKVLGSFVNIKNTEESGAQPLGVISKRNPAAPPTMPLKWDVVIRPTPGVNGLLAWTADAVLNGDSLNIVSGRDSWAITTYVVTHDHIAGDYVRGGMKHWFDVTTDTDRKVFEGTWGFYGDDNLPAAAQGTFSAKARN
ncbi:MAG: hypothetical protein V4655_07060 [Bdellovibrionota bacterium]|nr:MAG: hypothetical protein EOP10_11580 [Pseudomonadota bacterium]